MRYCTFYDRNLYKILLGCVSAFGNSLLHFAGLAKTPSDSTITVTNNDNSSECEGTTTFRYLGNAVNSNQFVFQFNVTIYFYFIHCYKSFRN